MDIDLHIAADAEGKIQIFNRAAAEILGYQEAETEGKMRLEELTGVTCAIVSTGSDRSETIVMPDSLVDRWCA